MAVNADPSSADFNAYASTEDADEYFASRLNATAWTGLPAETAAARKEAALRTATLLLDEENAWDGYREDSDQPLGFPRGGLVDDEGSSLPDDEVPDRIRRATMEYALFLLERDEAGDLQSPDVDPSEIEVGSVKLKFPLRTGEEGPVIPRRVVSLIAPFVAEGASSANFRVGRGP